MATDMNSMVNVEQLRNQILSQMLAAWQRGIAMNPTPTSYTAGTLPATAGAGQSAWVSNGRKPGEGVGVGTGVPAFFNPATATWYSVLSGTQVTS